jgi:hypothetical protein
MKKEFHIIANPDSTLTACDLPVEEDTPVALVQYVLLRGGKPPEHKDKMWCLKCLSILGKIISEEVKK